MLREQNGTVLDYSTVECVDSSIFRRTVVGYSPVPCHARLIVSAPSLPPYVEARQYRTVLAVSPPLGSQTDVKSRAHTRPASQLGVKPVKL